MKDTMAIGNHTSMKRIDRFLLALAIAASRSAAVSGQFSQSDPPETVPVSPEMRQILNESLEEKADPSQFRALVEDLFRQNKYAEVAQVGEYLHQFYDFEKRKAVIPVYASVIEAELSATPQERRLLILRALGRAAFVFDDLQILPSCDLAAVTDALLSATTNESQDLREEAYWWLIRIAAVDSQNADRIRKMAEARVKTLYDADFDPTNHEQTVEASKVERIIHAAGLPKYPSPYTFRDEEVPRTNDKSVNELIEMIKEARSRAAAATGALEGSIVGYLKSKLVRRTSPSEIVAVLSYGLEQNEPGLISGSLSRCFSAGSVPIEECRTLAVDFIVSSLEQTAGNTDRAVTMLNAMAKVEFSDRVSSRIIKGDDKPAFDSETSEKIYTFATGMWPTPEYSLRLSVYRTLRLINDYGEISSEKVAAFAKRAEDYELSSSHDSERARFNILNVLKRLRPSEAPRGN